MKDSELIYALMTAFEYQEYSFKELKKLSVPFNVTETSLRTNLSRMIKKNILSSRKEGKLAFYRLSKKGERIGSNVSFSFKNLDWSQWTGKWWGVLFTIPNEENTQRHAIRKKLMAYRFANLYPGFWIRPLHPAENIELCLESLIDNENCNLIRFDFFQGISEEDISMIWNLDEINRSFKKTIKAVHKHLAEAATYTPEEALKYKIIVGNDIVNALFADPMLPDIYLPCDWKGGELRSLFRYFDKTLTEIEHPYVKKVLIKKK